MKTVTIVKDQEHGNRKATETKCEMIHDNHETSRAGSTEVGVHWNLAGALSLRLKLKVCARKDLM